MKTETITFKECTKMVGCLFKITPIPEHWPKMPLQLIRDKNGVLTFFNKNGRCEIRFDLNEHLFSRYQINAV